MTGPSSRTSVDSGAEPDRPGIRRRAFLWTLGGASVLGLALRQEWWRDSPHDPTAGVFEDLGIPVHVGTMHDLRVGPDREGRFRAVYLAFAQADGGLPFLLVVDPDTGRSEQHFPPRDVEVAGFKSLHVGTDGYVYVGGYKPASLFRFDPRAPERGLSVLAERLPGANMVWWIQEAADGRLYMTTSVEARLYSWDPVTGRVRQHGRLSTENRHATIVAPSEDGWTLFVVVAPERYDVVAYDVRTEQWRGLLPLEQRAVGFIGVLRGEDGLLHAELPDGTTPLIQRVSVVGYPVKLDLDDGRWVRSTEEHLMVTGPNGAEAESIPLEYEAGATVFTVHAGPDERVYAFTRSPGRLSRYDPRTGELTVLGNPYAKPSVHVLAAASLGDKILMAAYPRCELAVFDPGSRWDPGLSSDHNPWIWGPPEGEGHTRPQAVVVGSDGFIYVGSAAEYGVTGGAVACVNPESGATLYNLRTPFRSFGVSSLAADPLRPLLYIGSSGPDAVAGDWGGARVMAWDLLQRRFVWEVVPIKNASSISSLNWIEGRLCGTTFHDYDTQHFFVLDPTSGSPVYTARTRVAGVINGNMRPGPDGWLYGLTYVEQTLFRVLPSTGAVETIAEARRAPGRSLAVTREGAYFGAGAALMRFKFAVPVSAGGSEQRGGRGLQVPQRGLAGGSS